MPVDILVGLQWGDEGKGKIIDLLCPQYDIIARFQGGPNAGHTLVIGNKKFVFHTLPSGVIHEKKINILGSGMVVDPIIFRKEIETLHNSGIYPDNNILISKLLHLILPTHRLIDAFCEENEGAKKIGSTLKGISPAYQDKVGRKGIRIGEILHADFVGKYNELKKRHLNLLCGYGADILAEEEEKWFDAIEFIKGLQITDTEIYLNAKIQEDVNILAEGAQGALLDVNTGTYPYVTSSNTISAGACTGLGISPRKIRKVIGICKAYTTRVGSGPFPTELKNEVGEFLTEKGFEYGSTTGRRRRCGWLDMVALKQSVVINGIDELVITKPDVLSGLAEVHVCTNYLGSSGLKMNFSDIESTSNFELEYKIFEGWKEDISEYKVYDQLPYQFRNYLNFIENETGVPITIISVGPERTQTIKKGL